MDRERVTGLVLGYLRDCGFDLAASALETEVIQQQHQGSDGSLDLAAVLTAGPATVGLPAAPPGELLRLLDEHDHLTAAAAAKQSRQGLVDIDTTVLDRPGNGQICSVATAVFGDLHESNILASLLRPDGLLLSAAVDKLVKVSHVNLSGDEATLTPVSQHNLHNAPVIALAASPHYPDLILSGCMGGQVLLCDVRDGAVKFTGEAHSKYVVRLAWSACGRFFASGSYDRAVHLYRRCDEDGADEPDGLSFVLARKLSFKGAVESLAFSRCEETPLLAVGIRDSNHIHLVNTTTFDQQRLNVNALGDDHVSFNLLELSFSPDGNFILASTDKDKLILYDVQSGTQVRTFYGADSDCFSSPRHCWDPSGLYVYGTSQRAEIVVWEVATQKIVATLKGHRSTIRDLKFCDQHAVLVSCGFDKTVRLWSYPQL
eukprot:m.307303 g.307303  ORF g.307303 m.307303 type:complete len:430 (+) comp19628_c1_seq3:2188-3477(+)